MQETKYVAWKTSLGRTWEIFKVGRTRVAPGLLSQGTERLDRALLSRCRSLAPADETIPFEYMLAPKKLHACGTGLKGESWASYRRCCSANTFFLLPAWSCMFFKYLTYLFFSLEYVFCSELQRRGALCFSRSACFYKCCLFSEAVLLIRQSLKRQEGLHFGWKHCLA